MKEYITKKRRNHRKTERNKGRKEERKKGRKEEREEERKNGKRKSFTFTSPRLSLSTAGISPPSVPSIVLCCFPVPGSSLLPCYVVLPSSTGLPLDLSPLLGCHSMQRLVHVRGSLIHYVLQSGFSATLTASLSTPVFRTNPAQPVHI